jgi:hypothetical protein
MVSLPAVAQVSPAQADPPGTIDGAKTPELISDETALALLLKALYEPNEATDLQKQRSRALARSAGLDETDTENLLRLARKFNSEIAILDAKAAQIHTKRSIEAAAAGRPLSAVIPSSDDGRALTSLNQDRKQATGRILLELQTTMSLNGADAFRGYLQTVKRKTKIIPD